MVYFRGPVRLEGRMSRQHVAFAFAALALVGGEVRSQQPVSPSDQRASTPVPLLIGSFPHVRVPHGNPMTPEKIQLGKALFFEEQISSDDTVACATCHLPDAGGGDPRAASSIRSPGNDGRMQTPDDEFGSFGVVAQDPSGNFQFSPTFGSGRQVRTSGSNVKRSAPQASWSEANARRNNSMHQGEARSPVRR